MPRAPIASAIILATVLVMLSLSLLLIAGIAFFSSFTLELAIIILIIGIDKTADAVSDVIYGLLQQQEQMDRIAKSLILMAVLSLLLLTLGQSLTHNLVWTTAGWCLGSIVVMVFYDFRSGAYILKKLPPALNDMRPGFDGRTLTRLAWLSLPLAQWV
jgi:O-antigen/teichoic acid export membrane protein